MSITGYLITKDRPSQSKALLDSLIKNSGNLLKNVCVLYKASGGYKSGYLKLEKEFPQFTWVDEDSFPNFRSAFLTTLQNIQNESSYVLGLTDDTFFYRPFVLPYTFQHFIDLFENNSTLFTIGLRLGKNTIHQNPDDLSDLIKIPVEFGEFFAMWNWTKGNGDHNEWYPISLDGHIYRTQELYNASNEIKFKNLREWEGELMAQVRNPNSFWSKEKFGIACPKLSYCVNVPLNMVNPPYYSTFGPYGITIVDLLEKFNNNIFIDFNKTFENVEITGSHQYIPMVFTKGN